MILVGPVGLAQAPAFPNPSAIKQTKLMCADVGGNHNKYYVLTLEKSSDGTFRCLINYGRVGAKGRFEVRAVTTQQAEAEWEFDEMFRAKTRGGKYTEVVLVSGTPGTALVSHKSGAMVTGKDAFRSGARAPGTWSARPQAFYNEMLREAQCMVETGMQVTAVSSLGLQTPLGIVADVGIQQALDILGKMPPLIATLAKSRAKKALEELEHLNSQFFRIIPTPVGGTRVKLRDNLIDDPAKVADKEQLLQSALGLIAAQAPGASTAAYPVLLEDVSLNEAQMLRGLLRAEKCRCHPEIPKLDYAQAFRVTRPADVAKYRKDLTHDGAGVLLFHGTRRTTAAGILSRGLLPTRAATAAGGHYSGSAYGDGVYFANNAGKSLGYTGASVGDRVMFVAFVAQGKIQTHNGRSSGGFNRKGGFDSIHAVGGNDLAHDEMIVPTTQQTCLAYVLEL